MNHFKLLASLSVSQMIIFTTPTGLSSCQMDHLTIVNKVIVFVETWLNCTHYFSHVYNITHCDTVTFRQLNW